MNSPQFEQGFALVIGVGETIHDKNLSLKLSVNEAQAVREVLVDPTYCGYLDDNIKTHVRLLCNESACKEQIMAELNILKERCAKEPDATAVIYFSGHGWSGPNGQFGLVPSDVKTSPEEFPKTIIRAEEFATKIQAIEAKRLLVILECCHAGGMGVRNDAPSQLMQRPTNAYFDLATQLQMGQGRCVISSCDRNQLSYFSQDDEIGIFTRCLIDAFKGIATPAGQQTVSIFHLINYLNETVPRTVIEKYQKEQNPFINYQGIDFPVARVNTPVDSGTKPSPKGLPHQVVPNRQAVRKLLRSLNESEFNDFVIDHYPTLYADFPDTMLLSERCRKLFEHCERRGQLMEMLEKIKQDFNDLYKLREDELFNHGE